MAFNVNEFSGALKGGGARASLFQVQITNPINGVADAQVPFMLSGHLLLLMTKTLLFAILWNSGQTLSTLLKET